MANDITQQLETLFNQQIEVAATLVDILKKEHDMLLKRQFGEMSALTEDKTTSGLQLEKLCIEQNQLLEANGHAFSKEGVDAFINALPKPQANAFTQYRNQLNALLEECKQLNLVNGNIIAANKQSAETVLAILRGKLQTDDKLIYGAGGQHISESSTKPITSA